MKKLFFLILITLFAFTATQVYAQDSVFDLKNYKTTDYLRSSLDLNLNLSESSQSSNCEDDRFQIYNVDKTNFFSVFKITSNFSTKNISRKNIISYGGTLDLSNSYENNYIKGTESQGQTTRTIKFNSDDKLTGFYNNDIYYSSIKPNFFIIGGDAAFYLNQSYEKDEINEANPVENGKYPQLNASAAINVGHGHGRLENVEDAVEALYILSDLRKNNLLARSYSENDIKLLADKITLINQERYFDFRLFKAKAMKELFSLLKDNGLVRGDNIDIFNIINDFHFMAGIPERTSGHRFAYYLSSGISYDYLKTSDTQSQNNDIRRIGFALNYQNNKPISIHWQRNFDILINFDKNWPTYFKLDSENNIIGTKIHNSNFSGDFKLNYGIQYLPNTRTTLYTNLLLIYRIRENIERYKKHNSRLFNSILNIGANYYLSERIRLSGDFSIRYINGDDKYLYDKPQGNNVSKSKDLYQSLNFSLTYYLF